MVVLDVSVLVRVADIVDFSVTHLVVAAVTGAVATVVKNVSLLTCVTVAVVRIIDVPVAVMDSVVIEEVIVDGTTVVDVVVEGTTVMDVTVAIDVLVEVVVATLVDVEVYVAGMVVVLVAVTLRVVVEVVVLEAVTLWVIVVVTCIVVVVVVIVMLRESATSMRRLDEPSGTIPEFEPSFEPKPAVTYSESPGPWADIVTAYLPSESVVVAPLSMLEDASTEAPWTGDPPSVTYP